MGAVYQPVFRVSMDTDPMDTIMLFPIWFQGNVSLIRMVDHFRIKIGESSSNKRCGHVLNRGFTPLEIFYKIIFGHGTI